MFATQRHPKRDVG